MTFIYLQCLGCGGVGIRKLRRDRCGLCGEMHDVTDDQFICKACGGQMIQIAPMEYDRIYSAKDVDGNHRYKHDV